jgi:hypothetical protein
MWTLAKRKRIIHKYGTSGGTASAYTALLSDIPLDDSHVLSSLDVPTMEECTHEYEDTKVSAPSTSIVFSSSLTPGRNLCQF